MNLERSAPDVSWAVGRWFGYRNHAEPECFSGNACILMRLWTSTRPHGESVSNRALTLAVRTQLRPFGEMARTVPFEQAGIKVWFRGTGSGASNLYLSICKLQLTV